MTGLKLSAVTVVVFLVCSLAPLETQADESFRRVVGLSYYKIYIAIWKQEDWWHATDYCHDGRMRAASINSQADNDLVAAFLNSSSEIDSFWLPATDYISEGTFTWVQTKAPLPYANWAPGSPSMSRTKNCIVIGKDGKWVEEPCLSETPVHFGLCEVPTMDYLPYSEAKDQDHKAVGSTMFTRGHQIQIPTEEEMKGARIEPIGGVGTKLYFKDETLTYRKLPGLLDFCHVLGMRLVSPETAEEFTFLREYALKMAMEGERDPLIFTSGTDALTLGCNRGNAMYRWFYSDKQAEMHGDGELRSRNWYQCVYISPSAFHTTDCIGHASWALCELDTAN